MTTRCKFVCSWKNEEQKTVFLSPVYSGSEENKQFFAATPGGQISLYVINPAGFATFEQGKEYFVDFTLAN